MYAQAGLSLCWSYIPHCWKSHVAVQIILNKFQSFAKNHQCLLLLSSPDYFSKISFRKANRVSNSLDLDESVLNWVQTVWKTKVSTSKERENYYYTARNKPLLIIRDNCCLLSHLNTYILDCKQYGSRSYCSKEQSDLNS